MNTRATLYTMALQADARMSETIRSRTGRDRWTMTPEDGLIPEVREAIRAKLNADEAWLMFLRTRNNSSGLRPDP